MKGRTCAGGSSQRQCLKQDESVTSPTASLETILTMLLIDAHEGKVVNIFDIPGAYLQANLNVGDDMERVILKLTGFFVGIMSQINPGHIVNVIYENSKKVLYMAILKAIYECIESALRWYELFSQILKKESFVINPYDRCVANKIINGKKSSLLSENK